MLFLFVEIYVAVEPILPPYLLRQKVPVLVGCSNALVAVCNLSVTYYCTFLNYSAGGVTRDTLAEFVHQANLLVTWDICPISARAINSTA